MTQANAANADHGRSATPAPEPADDTVTTRHTLSTPEEEFTYTATAGRLVLREEAHTDGHFDGHKPKAEMFVVSYCRDDIYDHSTRPVTFAFNGGPGSSSVWLHLGLLGPRRVLMGDVGTLLPPPYGLAANPQSLLAESDLVFIDPVSTGFSRVAEGEKTDEYHGFQRDIETVGELIRLWTSRNGRWMSPKFVAGESYGTVRAAALAAHLQRRYGLYLNGLMLISTVLDFGTIVFNEGNDLPYSLFLPTYACIANYHGRHGDLPLDDVRFEAEAFAAREYPWALAQGARLTARERADIVARLAVLTGLSEDYIDRSDLRIKDHRFFRELLRDQRLTVGRLDGRFTGHDADAAGERPQFDPSYAAIHGPFSAAINHYLSGELGYRNDLPYEILTDRVQPWSFREFEGKVPTVTDSLSEALRVNPHLHVHVSSGYYDAATPYYATEYALNHTSLPDSLRDNITIDYFDAGHMMYIHEPSRRRQSREIASFIRSCVAGRR